MGRAGYLALVLCSTSIGACLEAAPPSDEPLDVAETGPNQSRQRSGTPSYVPIAYMEGYGNPKTGELWVRTVPIAQDEAPEGVGVSGNNLSGYCSVTVESDGKVRDNPPGTFEYYTLGEVDGAPANHQSSFDPTVCTNTLPIPLRPVLGGDFNDPGIGVGCAYQHVMNFTSKTYDRVLLDIDVFNGEEDKHGAWGVSTTPGTPNTPSGRNAPHAQSGLWDFGPLAPGQESNMWIYFKNGDTQDFNWTGFLLGEIYEDCGDMDDEDCDGVDDNGCYDANNGDDCYDDSDCASGTCTGENIVSNIGNAGQSLMDDQMGTCTAPVDPQTAGTTLSGGWNGACAIMDGGEVTCWGNNASGNIGQPSVSHARDAAMLNMDGDKLVMIAGGGGSQCGLTQSNTLRCWGANNRGQSRGVTGGGNPQATYPSTPAPVIDLGGDPAVSVAVGHEHACALKWDGNVRCWGANDQGQCGDGTTNPEAASNTGVDVNLPAAASQLCAGVSHNCALLATGEIWCWGYNGNGQLGIGSTMTPVTDPTIEGAAVAILTTEEEGEGRYVQSLFCGGQASCAVFDDGTSRCWGQNHYGQLANGTNGAGTDVGDDEAVNTAPLMNIADVQQYTMGDSAVCALTVAGDVYCWGDPRQGDSCLGHGYPGCSLVNGVPSNPIRLGRPAVELSSRTGSQGICARLDDDGVKCWGDNGGEKVGIGSKSHDIGKAPGGALSIFTPPSRYVLKPSGHASPTALVLGQPNFVDTQQNQGLPDPTGSTMKTVGGVFVDPISGKVYVADSSNHRVLRFASREGLNDGDPAEAVFGQADLSGKEANRAGAAAANTLSEPYSVFVDDEGILWVADKNNHRVVGYQNAEGRSSGVPADYILGQSTDSANSGGLADDRMTAPFGIFVSLEGRMWVADAGNHRVLRFNHIWRSILSTPLGAPADGVLGQDNFSSNTAVGPNQNKTKDPHGVWEDRFGNVYVADTGHHRVLRWDGGWAAGNGVNATAVYGQPNFNSQTQGSGLLGFNGPSDVSGAPEGDLIIVADSGNNRLVAYQEPLGKGASDPNSLVLGQPSSLGNGAGSGPGRLNGVYAVHYDEITDGIWVADRLNNRVMRMLPPPQGAPLGTPDLVLGWDSLSTPGAGGGADAHKMLGPALAAVDPVSGKLFLCDTGNNRVLRFASADSLSDGDSAEAVLGQTDFGLNATGSGATEMSAPQGIHLDKLGRLWVVEQGNNRVTRFDSAASLPSGSAATFVLGQTDFGFSGQGLSDSKFFTPQGIFVTDDDTLWVADYSNSRVLRFDNVSLKSNGDPADGVLGQPDFISGAAPANMLVNNMRLPRQVWVDSTGILWVADHNARRILRFDDPNNKLDGADADGVLGKTGFMSDSAVPVSAVNNHDSSGVAVSANGWVYVADSGNHRILVFDPVSALMSGAAARYVLFQPDFQTAGAGSGADHVNYPRGLSFDPSGNLWIADSSNNRVLRIPNH